MGRVRCRCGNVISNTPEPTAAEFSYLDNRRESEFWETVREEIRNVGTFDPEEISGRLAIVLSDFSNTLIRCPECGRLIVFWDWESPGEFYTPEPSPSNSD